MTDYAFLILCTLLTALMGYLYSTTGDGAYFVMTIIAIGVTAFVGHGMWRDRQ